MSPRPGPATPDGAGRVPRVVLYSDPNCPFCFATEERLDRLGALHDVEWRGVQHAPGLPVPMVPTARPGGEDLAGEVAAIRRLAPEVAIKTPPGKPGTAEAIRWGAAALMADPRAGRTFVRDLYRALWTVGADLSDPAVLRGLADRAGLDALHPGPDAANTTAAWQAAWHDTGLPGVPQLVRDDGQVVYGLADASVLRAFLAGTPAGD
ncbi:unannotated protein [freshwater metagenome]|uniref:Unannotated protein n=1 Tax=freshwater metagenome TaxID=449393 RepID=A0A6J7HS40_9ZZZZ|nr:hypothetical protein [Actinomycetota bacterium]